jgi:hypothetical protein
MVSGHSPWRIRAATLRRFRSFAAIVGNLN